jgi:MFS family permease
MLSSIAGNFTLQAAIVTAAATVAAAVGGLAVGKFIDRRAEHKSWRRNERRVAYADTLTTWRNVITAASNAFRDPSVGTVLSGAITSFNEALSTLALLGDSSVFERGRALTLHNINHLRDALQGNADQQKWFSSEAWRLHWLFVDEARRDLGMPALDRASPDLGF